MKATLTFNLDDVSDRLAHTRAVKATDAYLVLWELANDVFRPARKHGYQDPFTAELVARSPEYAAEVIGRLEDMFYAVMASHDISLNDLE